MIKCEPFSYDVMYFGKGDESKWIYGGDNAFKADDFIPSNDAIEPFTVIFGEMSISFEYSDAASHFSWTGEQCNKHYIILQMDVKLIYHEGFKENGCCDCSNDCIIKDESS